MRSMLSIAYALQSAWCRTCTRDDGLPVRRNGEVQHPHGVPRQRRQLGHARLLPHHDLVLAVPVRADELVHVFGPGQVAHLRTMGKSHMAHACSFVQEHAMNWTRHQLTLTIGT